MQNKTHYDVSRSEETGNAKVVNVRNDVHVRNFLAKISQPLNISEYRLIGVYGTALKCKETEVETKIVRLQRQHFT